MSVRSHDDVTASIARANREVHRFQNYLALGCRFTLANRGYQIDASIWYLKRPRVMLCTYGEMEAKSTIRKRPLVNFLFTYLQQWFNCSSAFLQLFYISICCPQLITSVSYHRWMAVFWPCQLICHDNELAGTFDFFGLNHYTTQLVSNQVHGSDWVSYEGDQDISTSTDSNWERSGILLPLYLHLPFSLSFPSMSPSTPPSSFLSPLLSVPLYSRSRSPLHLDVLSISILSLSRSPLHLDDLSTSILSLSRSPLHLDIISISIPSISLSPLHLYHLYISLSVSYHLCLISVSS